MKKQRYEIETALFMVLVLLSYPVKTRSQSANQNYIMTQTYTSPTTHNDVIRYYDGLGRPVQTVRKMYTPSGKDMVTRQEYDIFGRQSKTWLPAPNTNSTGVFDANNNVASKYNGDSYAFSEIKYEPSPLNRVDEQYGPGQVWHNNTRRVKAEYLTNTSSSTPDLACGYYSQGETPNIYRRSGYYPAGQLFVTKITDEDNNVSYEFRDKLGRILLHRQIAGSERFDTYYIYDDFGNLCFVLPPVSSDESLQDGEYDVFRIDFSSYYYRYDNRNRPIFKMLAGIEHEYVFDAADRQVIHKTPSDFIFTKYDAQGRAIISGLYKGSNTNMDGLRNNTFRTLVSKEHPDNNNQVNYYYTWNTFPSASESDVTLVNYYDDYVNVLKWNANLGFVSKSGYGTQFSAKGLLTGTRSKILSADGSDKWITTVYYYDNNGNLIQKRSTNQLGGYDNEYYAYNYNHLMTGKFIEHTSIYNPSVHEEAYEYNYDAQLRPLSTIYISKGFMGNMVATPLAEYRYNELGQVQTKITGTDDPERTNFTYNIRGWEESRAGTRFEERLTYTSNAKAGGKTYFGGNISSKIWKIPVVSSSTLRGYAFQYDELGRLLNADYGETANLSVNTQRYSESFTYDKQGTPQTIQRYGRLDNGSFNLIDDIITFNAVRKDNRPALIMDFISNQSSSDLMEFKSVPIVSYNYITSGLSGALQADMNRRICHFGYNYLTLPQSVQFRYGHRIEYDYDALGMKRTVKYKESNRDLGYDPMDERVPAESDFLAPATVTKEYMNNKIYENNVLKYVLLEGGYLENIGSVWELFLYLQDYLGNNRVIMQHSGITYQGINYYPSGLTIAEVPSQEDLMLLRKYGGKELDRTKGLDFYDFEARQYDPALMRFTTPDPLAEKYYSISPYAYCANNPVRYVDPDGRDIWEINNEGKIINRIKDKTQDAFYMVAKNADGNYQRTFTTDADGNKTYNSISFEYGTVESQRTTALNSTDSYDTYKVRVYESKHNC